MVMGVTNGFNQLGGLNGLEAGMGAVMLTVLGILGFYTQQYWLVFICFSSSVALITFLFFNWYPAKIFPGDSLTLGISALIISVAIWGNLLWAAILLFIPYFLELFLKARSRFKAECFGEPVKDPLGRVILLKPYKKVYSMTHFLMPATETDIVISLMLMEIQLGFLTLIYYMVIL